MITSSVLFRSKIILVLKQQ